MKVWCEKKNGAEVWYIYLIFSDDLILSLLYAFSNEIGFIANNKTNSHRFPFNDDLFSSLNVTFRDETGFVTNSTF